MSPALTVSLVVAAVLLLCGLLLMRTASEAQRQRRQLLRAAAGHDVTDTTREFLTTPVSADLQRRTREQVAAGRKIEAIKDVRTETGLGLKQSKDIVDAIELGLSFPETAATPPATSEPSAPI